MSDSEDIEEVISAIKLTKFQNQIKEGNLKAELKNFEKNKDEYTKCITYTFATASYSQIKNSKFTKMLKAVGYKLHIDYGITGREINMDISWD